MQLVLQRMPEKDYYQEKMKQTPIKVKPYSWIPKIPKNVDKSKWWGLTKSKGKLHFHETPLSLADSTFSKQIIKRDVYCLNCGSSEQLSCSHFYRRAIYATRFDSENCITLCVPCHSIWETEKKPKRIYWKFMFERLGAKKLIELQQRSNSNMKKEEAIYEWNMRLILLASNNQI